MFLQAYKKQNEDVRCANSQNSYIEGTVEELENEQEFLARY